MPVNGLHFKAIEARRYQEMAGGQQVRIDHNSTLTLVQPEGTDRMRVEFSYTTSYGPLGVVKAEGALYWQDAKAAEAAAEWGRTRNLPPEVAQQVHSAIMSACVPEAVVLAREVRLPPPIPIPQVQFQKPQGQASAAPQDRFSPEIG